MDNKQQTIEVINALNGIQQTTLDMFRIIAAMFVMVGHSFSFYQMTVFKDQTFFPYIQNIGVVVFFLLSGFLTAYSIDRKNKDHQYTFSLFFKHKAVRIAKEYIPGLVLIAIIDSISMIVNREGYAYYSSFSIKNFIGNVFMLQNMGPNNVLARWFIPFGSGLPLWTLAVEWWLYMLYGVLCITLRNKYRISFSKLIIISGILYLVCDYLITGRGGGLGFVFALGVLGFYLYDLISQAAAKVVFVLSIFLYIVYGIIFKEAYTVYSFIIIWFIFCSTIRIGRDIKHNSKRNTVLAFVSKSTFMLYLIHYSVIDLIVHAKLECSSFIMFIYGILISLITAFCAYYIFGEKDVIGKLINVRRDAAKKD